MPPLPPFLGSRGRSGRHFTTLICGVCGALLLALKSATPFSVGDRVSYYITAGKGPSYDRARLASNWNPLSRDEDVRYYLKQLEDVAKLFDEFTPGRSRQGTLL
jgi:DNA polymerase elongation subunit (family B)